MDTALSIHLIKIAIYLIAFLFSSVGTSAVLWNSILNPKKPREAVLFYFLVTLMLTYLVGSLFIAFLGVELWIK
ncbi:hypothetical protein [Spiroplasma endosymbiont of Clivina fossor]|uniref:hypothetical protein n=1 Tax=Spiroplasma endosymbiont of Clivina fossor TaxID=3066282 RepID=UPI00313C532F